MEKDPDLIWTAWITPKLSENLSENSFTIKIPEDIEGGFKFKIRFVFVDDHIKDPMKTTKEVTVEITAKPVIIDEETRVVDLSLYDNK